MFLSLLVLQAAGTAAVAVLLQKYPEEITESCALF
jgi:hypothetical protein